MDLRLYYERPQGLAFKGTSPGSDGPDLTVEVDPGDPARFVFTVQGVQRSLLAVVEVPVVCEALAPPVTLVLWPTPTLTGTGASPTGTGTDAEAPKTCRS